MDILPYDLIPSILLYLPSSEIFTTTIYINQSFYLASKSIGFLRNLIQRDYYIQKAISISEQECITLLHQNISLKYTDDQNYLDFKGFITDGGIDEDNPAFWFENLFERTQKPYCCHEGRSNVNIGAVLIDTQINNVEYYLAKRQAITIVKKWLERKNKTVPKQYEQAAFAVFKYVFSNFPLDALATGEEEIFKEQVVDIYAKLEIKEKDPVKARRFLNNPFLLEIPIDLSEANNSLKLACIRGFDISRNGDYTCPVQTLMIFTSESYIDVTELSYFDNLHNEESLKTLIDNSEGNYRINEKRTFNGYEFIEFGRTLGKIKPILWLNFLNNPRVVDVNVNLNENYSGAYVYVKLIHPEDRRVERNWLHEDMNIDCAWVLPKGKLISLDYY